MSGEKLNQLQMQVKDATRVIIDEYSMVPNVCLLKLTPDYLRLLEKQLFYGSISIILVGDSAHIILPVGGHPLYATPPKTQTALQGLSSYLQF